MMTLEEYFKKQFERGIIDHAIRCHVHEGHVSFYIHPARESGDTVDFMVNGNQLDPRFQLPIPEEVACV